MLLLKIRSLWNGDENCTVTAVGHRERGRSAKYLRRLTAMPEPSADSHFSSAINFHSLSESCVAMRMLASLCSVIKYSARVPARRYVDNIMHFVKYITLSVSKYNNYYPIILSSIAI